jgi:putative Holliday junction resolvase
VTRGVVIGVDVGSVRVGVAASDPGGILATPVATLPRDGALDALVALVAEREAVEVVVGHPRHLSGAAGASARDAESFADSLRERVDVPVTLVDERLTTVTAQRALRRSGIKAKDQRAVVDQAAAVAILQSALDAR